MDLDEFLDQFSELDKKYERAFVQFKKDLPSEVYEYFKKLDLQYSSETKNQLEILQQIKSSSDTHLNNNTKTISLIGINFTAFKRADNHKDCLFTNAMLSIIDKLPADKEMNEESKSFFKKLTKIDIGIPGFLKMEFNLDK